MIGVTAIETSAGGLMLRLAVPVIVPELAAIVDCPATIPTARPEGFTLATVGVDDVQLAECVKSCWLPSLKVPVAVNCWVAPALMVAADGLSAIAVKAGTTPFPLSATVGMLLALPAMVSMAIRVPDVEGVKNTEIVQLVPAPNVFGLIGHRVVVV